MNYFRRRKILKSTSALELIPVRVHGHTILDDKVIILVPKFQSKWVHHLIPLTEKLFYRIKLDVPGSLTWLNITGDKSIAEITAEILRQSEEKGQRFEEAENRIQKFISILYDWKYITFRQLL